MHMYIVQLYFVCEYHKIVTVVIIACC